MYLFKGNLNLNTYLDDDGEIRCSIEKVSFENLFRTRFDTVIDLSSPIDLDGNPIAPTPVKTTQLHSKVIVKEFASAVTEAQSINSEDISRFVSVKMESASELTTELPGNQALPLSVNGIDPRDQDLFFFKIEEDGIYDMNFKASFTFKIMRIDFGGKIGTYYLTPRVMLQRTGVTLEVLEFNAFRRSGATNEKTITFDMNFDVNLSRNMLAGDVIYLDCVGQMQYAGASYFYQISNYLNSNRISGQTSSAGSTTLSYLLFDVANYLIGAATGQPNSLISSILDENGDFHDYVLANGFQIRNFLTSSKPLKMSLKDFFEGVFQIAGLGYNFQILNGKEYVVIEKVADFFQMREIIKLDEIYEYKEEHGKDFVYNELEIGYEKYPEEESNTLDEPNTYKTALTPIKTYKQKFTKKSKLIASGYILERQRREQFQINPSESLSNDDDVFIISVIKDGAGYRSEKNEQFSNIEGLFSPETAYNLRLTPSRIEYNWAPLLNISFSKKLGTDVIKTTFIKNNDKLKSYLIPSDTRRRYEPNFVLEEKGDVDMNRFKGDNRKALHLPQMASFKAIIDYSDYIFMKACLTGNRNWSRCR